MSAHTPEPWKSQGWVPTWAYIPVHDAQHNLVASLYPDDSHGYSRKSVEANARLIAAAPDLLSLVKRFIALPSGAWHPERHAAEERDLAQEAKAIVDRAESKS